MFSNPLTPQEILQLAQQSVASGQFGPVLPNAYVFATPPTEFGPPAFRLFDAAYITTGIIDPNRLGTGATGAGNLYLADDGTWKPVSGGGGVGTLDQVTDLGNVTTNTIDVGGVKSDYFLLDTTATPTLQPGMFGWNDAYGTADLRLKGNNVTLQLGQEILARVVNKTGADLLESDYKVVRVRIASEGGAQGQRLAVVLAQGDNDPDSATTLGIVTETIADNQEGFITILGNVNGINTTGSLQGETWVDGDVLYLSPTTPGGLTKVKPTAPDHTVTVGYVVYAHANQGKIFVKVDNGYELDELHNVKITSVANNDLLQYDSTQQVWKNVAASVAVPTPTLAQVTTAGNTTTNAISVGALNVNISGVDRVKLGTGLIEIYDAGNVRRFFAGTSGPSGQLLIDSGGSWDVNFLGGGFKYLRTGNFAIGTTTDAGYKLDVNGTLRVQNTATIYDSLSILRSTLLTDVFTLYSSTNSGITTPGRGQFILQHGGLEIFRAYSTRFSIPFTPLQVGINSTDVAMLQVSGTRTASSALAQGVYFNNTLVAAANNDVLVGLDINPTFTNGAFTGVSNLALRVKGSTQYIFTTGDGLTFNRDGSGNYIQPITQPLVLYSPNSSVYQYINNSGVGINTPPSARLHIKGSGTTTSTTSLRVENSSGTIGLIVNDAGNILLGTATDAGYKLDVNGTFRSNNSVYLATASGSVGIGTTTPNYILDVYQTNVKAQIRSTGENQNATLFLGTPFGGTSSPKVAIIARAKTSWSRADLAFCLSDNQSSNSVEATISDLRMVILSDGKVGVNVANPTYQFQVSGDIALSGNLVPTAGSQTLGTFTNRFGDVWAGGLIVGSTFYGDNHQSASGNLYFKEGGGIERMRMTSSGNFMIGTITDAGDKLQVNGVVRATGFSISGAAGFTGIFTIPTNPPGQQNLDIQGGIIVNVF